MQQNSGEAVLKQIEYLVGNIDFVQSIQKVRGQVMFNDRICCFLNEVSKRLRENPESRKYSDVVTFGFWIRRASVEKIRQDHTSSNEVPRLGRGVAFHIAPSNVPVNFAYSLVAGLLTGNANIVRVPSRKFPQIDMIVDAIEKALSSYEEIRPYIVLVRYERKREINDYFSAIADTRIVWGGDSTIEELRKSPLPPRSKEITFADRYSLCVIDSEVYLSLEDKKRVAQDFYNDTYFSDQNACTSPRLVVWTGEKKGLAKEKFWTILHELVEEKYEFQPIQSVNKLTSAYLTAAVVQNVHIEESMDNLIVRVNVPCADRRVMEFIDNSGFFFEYDCEDILDLQDICDDTKCQTIGYIGDVNIFNPLVEKGIKGVDRIVPVGRTMDFDLIWDGYDLVAEMTRVINIM